MKPLGIVCATALLMSAVPSLSRAQTPDVAPTSAPAAVGAAFPADSKIGFVDLGLVASRSKQGQALFAKIDDIRTQKESEVAARGKDVAALQDKWNQASPVLTDAAREQLRKQFERAQVDFQRFTQDAQAEVAQVQRELEQAFMQKAFPAIAAVAKERSLWAVFSVAESGLLWREQTLDISTEIAQRIDTAP